MTQADGMSRLAVATPRSGCPINLTAELLGDRWSLLVLRDLAFGGPRHYRELLAGSTESIATNILSGRLRKLTAAGMLTKRADPTHAQRFDYCLAEPAIDFLPVLVAISMWASRWLPVDPSTTAIAEALDDGGPELQARFMDELRSEHLGGHAPTDGALRLSLA
ncbi:transcriptional regulator [Nocardioides seonyuensis]|uniref:Transcriptional regulator n=1 Tax=Nocardioides seonyuensis TaxID=2518371 RepID=A0A4P7IK90_9ACTN|nr:helix-turn-helix domain-containing protein [Nocardioides seonyuensis]QBX56757.1 transcriptional regulator [Nocardioides seonyuensis]